MSEACNLIKEIRDSQKQRERLLAAKKNEIAISKKILDIKSTIDNHFEANPTQEKKFFSQLPKELKDSIEKQLKDISGITGVTLNSNSILGGNSGINQQDSNYVSKIVSEISKNKDAFSARTANISLSEPQGKYTADFSGLVATSYEKIQAGIDGAQKLIAKGAFDADAIARFNNYIQATNEEFALEVAKLNDSNTYLGSQQEAYKVANKNEMLAKRLANANGDVKEIQSIIDKATNKKFVDAMHFLYNPHNGIMNHELPLVENTLFVGNKENSISIKPEDISFDVATNTFEYKEESKTDTMTVPALAKLYGLGKVAGSNGIAYTDIINLPSELRNIINIAVIPQAEKVATLIAEADLEKVEDIFGVSFSTLEQKEATMLAESFYRGYVPRSVLVNKLGEEIYRNSPVKFLKVADKDLELKAITELGLLAIMHMKNIGVIEYGDTVTYNEGKITQSLIKFVGYGEAEHIYNEDGTVVLDRNGNPTLNYNYAQFKALVDAGRELEFLGFTEDRNLPTLKPVPESVTNPQHKMRNSNLSYSESVAKRIDKMNHSPLRFTKDMEKIAEIYEEDREKAFKLLGIDHVDTSKNIADQAKEAAKLAYSRMQLDALVNFYNKVGHNQDFYLKYEMTVSERYMVDSIINPQESKIARFLMTGHSFEYDGVDRSGMETTISRESVEKDNGNFELYKLGLAQAFDLGPDKWSDRKSLNDLEYQILKLETKKDEFEKLIHIKPIFLDGYIDKKSNKFIKNVFKDGYESFKKVWDGTATEQDYANVNKAVLKGEKVHVIQAFTSLMDLENHDFSKGDASLAFTFESDAITSGMGLTTAQIGTEEAMALAAKSGIYEEKLYQRWLNVYTKIESLLSDESKMPTNDKGEKYFNHGLILTMSDELQNKTFKMTGLNVETTLFEKILKEKNLSEDEIKTLEELRDFRDIYNTVATEADSYMDEMKKDFKSIVNGRIPIEDIQQKYPNLVIDRKDEKILNADLFEQAQAILGAMEKIKRSTAKPPTMVYIYGSMMSSIKRKLLGDVFAPQVYKVLNMPFFNPAENDGFALQNRIMAIKTGYENPKSDEATYKDDFEKEFASIFNGTDLSIQSPKQLIYAIANSLEKLQYQEYDPIARNMRTIKASEAQGRYLVIGEEILSQFKEASDLVLGEAFTQGFKKFGVVDNFRSIVKQVELVRFTIFKSQLNEYLRKMSKDGTYKISLNDIADAIMAIQDSGYGHSVRDINGSSQPLYKKEKIKGELVAGLRSRLDKKAIYGTAQDFTYNPNTGASGVVTVHSLDGFIDSLSGMSFNLIRIYDGSVSGTDSMVDSLDKYNQITGEAISYNILGNQIKDLATAINSLGGFEKFNESVINLNNRDRDELSNSFEVLMGLGKLYSLENDTIDNFHSDAQEFVANSEAARAENKVRIAHSYITDQAEPQSIAHKLLDGDNTSKEDIETVMRSFGSILENLREYNKELIELNPVSTVVLSNGKPDISGTLKAFAKANAGKRIPMQFITNNGDKLTWEGSINQDAFELKTKDGTKSTLTQINSAGKIKPISYELLTDESQKQVIGDLYSSLGLIDKEESSSSDSNNTATKELNAITSDKSGARQENC